jgi:7-cyano-7-deazaguanine synthase
MPSAVVVVSGGLDSVTLLHYIHHTYQKHDLHVVSFDYGQRHKKELEYARYHAALLHAASYRVVDITSITSLLGVSGSSLVSDNDVPEGHYAEVTMKATVVPNRNMIMSSIAAGYAVAVDAEFLALGVHAGDHFIYPDCRPNFFKALNAAIVLGNAEFGNVPEEQNPWWRQADFVVTPWIDRTKTDIARAAKALDVDVSMTWSCYKGGDIHCGKCGTCVERLEAFAEAEIEDQTEYLDNEFWKEQVG